MARHSAKFTHIGLPVSDVSKSVAFYEKWAGMKVTERVEHPFGIKAARLSSKGQPFVLSLFEAPAAPSLVGLGHLGMTLASNEDVDKLAADAKKEGIGVIGPEDTGSELGYQVFLSDPDGNNLEFSAGQSATLAVE